MASIVSSLFNGGEARAQRWLLRNCDKNHTACRPALPADGSPSFLPTRVLDVRRHPDVCLVESATLVDVRDRRYVALSYCWGPTMPEEGKTIRATLEAHKSRIDVAQLPQTLREAVSFTRLLGAPFLWIDSLCIVQDDQADWEREAVAMSSVYSSALLTVAAAVSDHCDGGFLRAAYDKREVHEPRQMRNPPRSMTDGGDFNYTLNFDLRAADLTNIRLRSWHGNPLLGRGWALQERELSPRMLHFTRTHCIWECRELAAVYTRPRADAVLPTVFEPFLNHIYPDHNRVAWQFRCLDVPSDKKGFGFNAPTRGWPDDPVQVRFRTWQGMVEDYSRRRLTFPTDKAPAIAGIAEALRRDHVRCDYLAGLWRDNLLNDLLWYRAAPDSNGAAVATHRALEDPDAYAPSWSWTWTHFPVRFVEPRSQHAARVVEAQAGTGMGGSPAAGNGKGKAVAAPGFVRLETRVCEVDVSKTHELLLDNGEYYVGGKKARGWRREEPLVDQKFTVCVVRTHAAVPHRRDERYIRGERVVDEWQAVPAKATGLVLRAVDDGPAGVYRRIGLAIVELHHAENEELEEITLL